MSNTAEQATAVSSAQETRRKYERAFSELVAGSRLIVTLLGDPEIGTVDGASKGDVLKSLEPFCDPSSTAGADSLDHAELVDFGHRVVNVLEALAEHNHVARNFSRAAAAWRRLLDIEVGLNGLETEAAKYRAHKLIEALKARGAREEAWQIVLLMRPNKDKYVM